ncbi:phage antirepressor KilAC domain-containing protein [Ruminococcus sp.]|jgi:anti-repressor protein|uniref:phage antirepressor KilAC domain-containing protein n=1 Tax=Ruminococcus sp. TaxID=41978 RepID=UPI003AF5F8B5|nr:phage antirepressor KilAC domain-containing protein [Oscillospiraceae bacterium]
MNELIKISYENAERPTVSGRELHEALEVKTAYKDWFPRMCEYGFTEGEDFNPLKNEQVRTEGNRQVSRELTDHQLTIPMAKEICMLQRSEKGKQFRQYFIRVEEAWNSPEMIMKRALEIANEKVKALQVSVSQLTVDKQIMQPKADYFDELVDRNLLTGIRETAKELKVKQNTFVNFLLDKKYLYRDKKGKLMPYAKPMENGLFEIKEFSNEKTGFSSTQVFITPKGKETFRLLLL